MVKKYHPIIIQLERANIQTTANFKPDYSNWVSKKFIYVQCVLALLLIGLSFRQPAFYLLALPFLLITTYLAYAWWRLSPQGGNVQAQIVDLLLKLPFMVGKIGVLYGRK